MRKIEHSYVHGYEAILSGAAPQTHTRPSAYLANDQRILSASNQLIAGELLVIEFLHRVSHTIDNVYDPQQGFVDPEDEDEDDVVHAPPPPPLNVQPLPIVPEPRGRGGRQRRPRGGLALRENGGQPIQGKL